MRRRQQGITFIGFVVILALVVFAGIIGMRLFPIYQEYFSVVQAMKGVAAEPGSASWTPLEIRQAMQRRLDINYVESVERQDILVNRDQGGYNLIVAYEVRRPLIGNLDVVAVFDKRINLLEE